MKLYSLEQAATPVHLHFATKNKFMIKLKAKKRLSILVINDFIKNKDGLF